MERQKDERLHELESRGIQPYSISRLDTINHCLYEAYRTYRLHDRGRDNVYTSLGSAVHDVLEGITNGENTEDDLLPAVYKELDDLDLIGLEFPKDRNGGDSIRQGWIADMEHFCKTYKAPKGNLIAEELFVYKTPKGRYLIGYIDLQKVHDDGTVDIYDYKTSSMYSKADMQSHGRQLVTYLLGKEQEGKKIKRVAWIFLKYAEVKFIGKKTIKSKSRFARGGRIRAFLRGNTSETTTPSGVESSTVTRTLSPTRSFSSSRFSMPFARQARREISPSSSMRTSKSPPSPFTTLPYFSLTKSNLPFGR